MSKLLKPLIVLIFLCSIGAAVLGYLVFEQRKEIKSRTLNLESSSKQLAQNLEYEEADLAKLKSNIQKVDSMQGVLKHLETHASIKQQEIHDLTADLAAETELRKQREEELAATKTELEGKKQEVVQLEGVVQQKKQEITSLEEKAEDLKGEIATKESEINTLNGELATRNDEIGGLKDEVARLEAENQEMFAKLHEGDTPMIQGDLVGRVVLVNSEWGYVVLDIGSEDGLKANATAIVHRDDEFVGKVLITSVEDATAVADVIAGWQQVGFQVGDMIFFN